jgi:hypothetical protein
LLGARIQFLIDADGRVQKVEGVDELLGQIGTIGKPQDQALFKQLFSGDILKAYVSFADMMPDRPVAIGDNWSNKIGFVSPVGTTLVEDMNYTFKNRETHRGYQCMHIGIAGSISSKTSATASNSPNETIKGDIVGDAWFDPELGMVVDASYDQKMTLEIANRGQAMTLQVEQKIHHFLISVE